MICSDCGREIADNAISCQYCGKVFISQRARAEVAPVHEQITQLSGQLRDQELATGQAVTFRRKQRWFFYAVIVMMFIGVIVAMVNIYSSNSKAVADVANLQLKYAAKEKQLVDVQKELDDANAVLNDKDATVTDFKDKLFKSTKSLTEMTEANKKLDEKLALTKQASELSQAGFIAAEATSYNLIMRLGVSLTAAELVKIPIALSESDAVDTDKDGLPDELEKAIGTDEIKMDTDADGYDDRAELEKGYNPTGTGPWSNTPSEAYKNKIVLNKQNGVISAWYVALNGKRYYLGIADNSFQFMMVSPYWKIKQEL